MRWDEMRWSQMGWNEMGWNEMIVNKWNIENEYCHMNEMNQWKLKQFTLNINE
jgi:hypothetical protein